MYQLLLSIKPFTYICYVIQTSQKLPKVAIITSSFSYPLLMVLEFKLSALPMLGKYSTHNLPTSACQ